MDVTEAMTGEVTAGTTDGATTATGETETRSASHFPFPAPTQTATAETGTYLQDVQSITNRSL